MNGKFNVKVIVEMDGEEFVMTGEFPKKCDCTNGPEDISVETMNDYDFIESVSCRKCCTVLVEEDDD